MVVQAGKTPLPDIRKALGALPQEKVLGIVLNRNKSSQNNHYYPNYPKK
jgi:Mrp family chromosome partitioning ATPase